MSLPPLPPLPAPRPLGPLTRGRLAAFAEASGDLNPLHLDPDFARAAGYGDVMGQGMLAMGAMSAFLGDWAAEAGLRVLALDCRFTAPMPLGARLTLHLLPGPPPPPEGAAAAAHHLRLEARLADGTRALRGRASLVPAERQAATPAPQAAGP